MGHAEFTVVRILVLGRDRPQRLVEPTPRMLPRAGGEQSIAVCTGKRSVRGPFSVNRSVGGSLWRSFGRSDEDLVRLAQSVTVEGLEIKMSDPAVIPDYQLVTTVPPWLAVQGIPIEFIYYASKNDVNGGVGLTVAPRQPAGQGGATLDRQIALRFFLDQPSTFEVDGHVAMAGQVAGQRDLALATWIAGDHVVTISGYVPVDELTALARRFPGHQGPVGRHDVPSARYTSDTLR